MSQKSKVPLSKVASVFNGKTPSKTDQRSSGYPVLKIKDISEDRRFKGIFESFVDADFAEKFNEKKIISGDILILNAAHNADYVATKIYKAEKCVEGALATGEWTLIRTNEASLDSRYAYYWFLNEQTRYEVRQLVKGIHLYPKDVARLQIPFPPLEEQRRIAAILDKADDVRRKRQSAIALTEELLRSAFLEMFGDPVTNPKGWDVLSMDKVIQRIEAGWSANGEDFRCKENEWGVLKISAVTSGRFQASEHKVVEDIAFKRLLIVPQRGDLLFSRANTRELVAATCLVEKNYERLFLPDKLWRITPDSNIANTE